MQVCRKLSVLFQLQLSRKSTKVLGSCVNDFFFQKFQIHYCSLWRNQKPQLSGKRAIVEQNRVKFGTRDLNIRGTFVLLVFKGHFEVIRCTCDFS